MKATEIIVGNIYLAEVFGRLRRCRILDRQKMPPEIAHVYWKVKELGTGNSVVVHSRNIKEHCKDLPQLRLVGLDDHGSTASDDG